MSKIDLLDLAERVDVGRGRLGVQREEEAEDCAVVFAAADGEAATVAVDDVLGDPEAKAGAGQLAGGEEGVEDLLDDLGRHAVAGVGEDETDAAPAGGGVGGVVGAETDAAAGSHGVDGVCDEVAEDLADFALEAVEGGWGDVAAVDGDAGVGEPALVEGGDGVEELGGGDGGGTGALAMEAQGLGGDLGAADDFGFGEGEVVGDVRVEVLVGAGDVDEVGDGFEGIVDLVGDGGGEASDGGEFFGLDEGCLGALEAA